MFGIQVESTWNTFEILFNEVQIHYDFLWNAQQGIHFEYPLKGVKMNSGLSSSFE